MRRSRHCGDLWKPAKFWTLSPPPFPPVRRRDSPDEHDAAAYRRQPKSMGRMRAITTHSQCRFARRRDGVYGGLDVKTSSRTVDDGLAEPPARPPACDRCRRGVRYARRRWSLRTRVHAAAAAAGGGGQRPSGVRRAWKKRAALSSTIRHRVRCLLHTEFDTADPDHAAVRSSTAQFNTTRRVRSARRAHRVTSTPAVRPGVFTRGGETMANDNGANSERNAAYATSDYRHVRARKHGDGRLGIRTLRSTKPV